MNEPRAVECLGIPPEPRPMPAALASLCRLLVGLMAVLGFYALVADEPDRMVVIRRAEFERVLQAERIQAAQAMAGAIAPDDCVLGWTAHPRRTPRGPL